MRMSVLVFRPRANVGTRCFLDVKKRVWTLGHTDHGNLTARSSKGNSPSMLKRLTLLFALVFAGLVSRDAAFNEAGADGMRVAVVNLQRAVMSTEDGLRATANVKKIFDARQNELGKIEADLKKQGDDLEKQAKLISKDAYSKKREELQKQFLDYQARAMEANKELDKKQRELTDPIVEKMLGIVKRIATTENYDIVVDSSPSMAGPWGAVAYARTDLDLTDKCIQTYNSGAVGTAPATSGSAAQKKP